MSALDIRRTVSRASVISLPGSINTKRGYKEFCKSLYQTGITPEMISQKKKEIIRIFKSQDAAASVQGDGSTFQDQTQLPVVSQFAPDHDQNGV